MNGRQFESFNELIQTKEGKYKVNEVINSVETVVNPEETAITEDSSDNFHTKSDQSKGKKSKSNKSTGNVSPVINQEKRISFQENALKKIFLSVCPHYYWEAKDDVSVEKMRSKMLSLYDRPPPDEELKKGFSLFLQNLPEYWRTKKMTIPQLEKNFNEIINEIRTTYKSSGGTNSSSNDKFGYHELHDLQERANSFGR